MPVCVCVGCVVCGVWRGRATQPRPSIHPSISERAHARPTRADPCTRGRAHVRPPDARSISVSSLTCPRNLDLSLVSNHPTKGVASRLESGPCKNASILRESNQRDSSLEKAAF